MYNFASLTQYRFTTSPLTTWREIQQTPQSEYQRKQVSAADTQDGNDAVTFHNSCKHCKQHDCVSSLGQNYWVKNPQQQITNNILQYLATCYLLTRYLVLS